MIFLSFTSYVKEPYEESVLSMFRLETRWLRTDLRSKNVLGAVTVKDSLFSVDLKHKINECKLQQRSFPLHIKKIFLTV